MFYMEKGLSRTSIKYIVTLAMVINHAAQIFMPEWSFLRELLISIGYVTAITMSFFLVEGFSHTRDRKKYIERLFIFALISELPFNLAFTKEGIISFHSFSFMFSLTIAASVIYIMDEWEYGTKRNLALILLMLLSLISDWDIFSILFVLLFRWAGKDRKKIEFSVLSSALLFAATMFLGNLGAIPFSQSLVTALFNFSGMALSAVFIVKLYNGEKGGRGTKLEKWFFYAFYPLHLIALAIIRLMIF